MIEDWDHGRTEKTDFEAEEEEAPRAGCGGEDRAPELPALRGPEASAPGLPDLRSLRRPRSREDGRVLNRLRSACGGMP